MNNDHFAVRQFEIDLDGWARRNSLHINDVVRAVASRLFENIVRRTPVDTGWARANWVASIDEKIETGPGKAPEGVTGIEPADFNKVIDTGEAGNIFWLQNGVPYIHALEYGHSQQAPTGMVRVSVAEAFAFFKAEARSAGRRK